MSSFSLENIDRRVSFSKRKGVANPKLYSVCAAQLLSEEIQSVVTSVRFLPSVTSNPVLADDTLSIVKKN